MTIGKATAGHLPGSHGGTAQWIVREMPTPAVGLEQADQGWANAVVIGSMMQRSPVCLTAPMRQLSDLRLATYEFRCVRLAP